MTSKRGYSEEQAEARLSAQIPVEEKAARSHYVIENSGSAENLKQEAKRLLDWLKGR
jgi:dephospho-CoA kinase